MVANNHPAVILHKAEPRYIQLAVFQTLGKWINLYRDMDVVLSDEQELLGDNKRLRKENRLLREERELLKKATIFFADQSK